MRIKHVHVAGGGGKRAVDIGYTSETKNVSGLLIFVKVYTTKTTLMAVWVIW